MLGYSGCANQTDLMLLAEFIDNLPAFEIVGAVQDPVCFCQLGVSIVGTKMLFYGFDLYIRIELFKLARCYLGFIKTSVAVAE